MRGKHHTAGNHRGHAATVVTAVLALSGVACIGFVATHQPRSPQPSLSAVDSLATRDRDPASTATRPRPATGVVGPVLATSSPLAVSIPAIGVRSSLLHLGQTAKGAMEVPPPGPQYDKAGWYRYSPTPGALGPAVIAGHVDSAAKGPSVFFRLGSLRPDDTIQVSRTDGSVAVFVVDEVRRYPKDGFPSKLVYGDTNHAALRLITCGGQFEGGHYKDNIVVFASLARATAVAPTPAPVAG